MNEVPIVVTQVARFSNPMSMASVLLSSSPIFILYSKDYVFAMSNSLFTNKTQKNLINEVDGGIITYVKSKYNIQNKKGKICSHKR